ncbi:uncharacterized protein LOC125029527 [Penaeus chinensis]|uniref:uncharacterized protein LOC125029527 n=1 Tax=Penaeus chinensis TaxID=139456 RepID=UPI001FB77D1D|nr:uncharacterized protein LOC125029527 [Penaeus chinensis]
MSNTNVSNNDVNEAGTNLGEGLTSGRCPADRARGLGRHKATVRKKWSTQDNICVMTCYYESQPEVRGYRQRLYAIWNENGMAEVTEQRLCDQVRMIQGKGWLTELQLEEIRRNVQEGRIGDAGEVGENDVRAGVAQDQMRFIGEKQFVEMFGERSLDEAEFEGFSRFYQELDGRSCDENVIPDKEETREFWSGIWEKDVRHNESADWIQVVAEEMQGNRQQDIQITATKVRKRIRKIANWKAPGPDGVHGYWIKGFVSLQERIASHLQDCITKGEVPDWMTTGRTVLLLKDKSKGNEISNYRPITCLPLMWKLLTGIVADDVYDHLNENDLLPEEQKGCRRNSRGTKDQLLIDKTVLKNCRRRKVGLSMVWIDYRKAYDMLPHSWIKKSMEMCGVAENIVNLLSKSMESWRTILTSGNEELASVNIKRGIFQGDTLSPLLFVIGLIPLSHILRNDIYMEFGLNKCAHVTMKAGKLASVGGMELSSGEVIPELESDKGYKYLGILEVDDIMHAEMKDKIRKEYYRRVRQLTSSKLNRSNVITAVNSRAVSLVRYSAGILKWTKDELNIMDRKTRKIMTMNRMYHPQSDIDRLYIPRKEGGRGLLSIVECVENEEHSLSLYVDQSEEMLLKLVKSEGILPEYEEPREYKQRHDSIARIVHLELCQKFELVGEVKWYNHRPESVMENDRVKILWDFNIQTDHVIQHRRPDIVVVYKDERKFEPDLCTGTQNIQYEKQLQF